MGVYLYNQEGGREFFKDPAKSNEMIAAGYTFEPVEKVEKVEKVDKKSRKNRDK